MTASFYKNARALAIPSPSRKPGKPCTGIFQHSLQSRLSPHPRPCSNDPFHLSGKICDVLMILICRIETRNDIIEQQLPDVTLGFPQEHVLFDARGIEYADQIIGLVLIIESDIMQRVLDDARPFYDRRGHRGTTIRKDDLVWLGHARIGELVIEVNARPQISDASSVLAIIFVILVDAREMARCK